MTTIILERFANREYRLTNQTIFERKKEGGDKYAERQAEKYAVAVRDTFVLQKELQQGEAASISDGKLRRRSFGEIDARLGLSALDIIDEFRQTTKLSTKGGWGKLSRPTSFTRNARHRLLEAGAIVDKECGDDAWEITLTLPGSTPDAVRTCAEYSGWLIDRLLREVRREKCLHWFYVWEFQKKGKLHLHFLVAGKQEQTKSIAHCVDYQWWELLWELSNKTGIDMFRRDEHKTWKYESSVWQSHTAKVYKSVAAYFSKYAGKGSSEKHQGFTRYQRYCPSRFWGCSSYLKQRIGQERQTWKLNVSTCTAKKIEDYLQIWLDDKDRVKKYSYEFQLGKTANGTELGGGGVWINYYTTSGFERLQSWEDIMWSGVLAIAKEAGEYDDPTQTWTDADMACRHPLHADMEQRRHDLCKSGIEARRLPPSTPSQPSNYASKLRNARGTQAEPTLALRALALQFLAGVDGGTVTKEVDCERATEYIQGDLFDKSYYERLTMNL